MNKKRAAWLVAALMAANGISGGYCAAGAGRIRHGRYEAECGDTGQPGCTGYTV